MFDEIITELEQFSWEIQEDKNFARKTVQRLKMIKNNYREVSETNINADWVGGFSQVIGILLEEARKISGDIIKIRKGS